ncbi:MAG: hypothetical protein R3Y57_03050 [Erysipelotrichaceae bacterium]
MEYVTDFIIYDDMGESVCSVQNMAASSLKSNRGKGICYFCKGVEYKDFDEILSTCFPNLSGRFKVAMIDCYSDILHKYVEEHHLNIEEYN